MSEARELLKQLSGERIRHEFDLIFNEPDPIVILRRLEELDLLEFIHPKLKWDTGMEKPLSTALNYYDYPEWNLPAMTGNTPTRLILAYLVWLISLPAPAGSEIGKRLRLSNQILEILEKSGSALNRPDFLKRLPPSQFTAECDKVPILGIFALFCLTPDDELKKKFELYASTWRRITPHLDGNSLREKGIPPGPLYSKILAQLREAWLDGEINSETDELEFLEKLLKTHNG